MAVESKNLGKILEQIKKRYGDESVRMGDDDVDMVRVPTGIPQLDALVGGGFPMGRYVHMYGGFGSGKTLTCWHLIREAQQMGLTCAYYNLEKQYSKAWAEGLGIDVANMPIIEGNVIEEVGTNLEALLGAVNIHVIDSVGVGVSTDELAADVDEWRPGISARAWGKVIRRSMASIDKDDNMIILVNQAREVFGKMGGENPTGGSQIEYASSLSLHFKKSSWLYRDKNDNLSPDGKKKDDETGDIKPAGIDFSVRVKKSRVCDPYGTARLRLEFGTGGHFDDAWAIARAAIFSGEIAKSGSWYTLPDGERVQGTGRLIDYIHENPVWTEKIKEIMKNG